jgi:hypothetical protein
MKGLIIKDPWITKILNGEKTWEIRGSNTNIRGTISLIKSGTGMIYGTVDLVDSGEIDFIDFSFNRDKHQLSKEQEGKMSYKNPHAWVMKNPTWHAEPVSYKHPQGAVIWVNL